MIGDSGALSGVKVIELAHIMAGPVCGLMLADMGADVIKVEKSPDGDDSRRMVPPTMGDESAAFLILNRNKRGVVINLKDEAGKEALRDLLGTADVVIENYRPGTMERLGLGYEALAARNPALIYCQITGFGRTGPYAMRAGFDLIAQGMSGLMSVTGEGPERPPVKVGVPVGDVTAGILAAMGVLAAYVHRLKTGRGQRVDTSLLEASMIHTYWPAAIYFATGLSAQPMGTAHPLSAPYQAFETSDGWINIGAANQANWLRMLNVLGANHLAEDSRFADNAGRRTCLGELTEALTPLFRRQSTEHWLQAMEQAGVPAGPVLSTGEVLNDPQVQARDMVVEVEHSRLGRIKTMGAPVKLSATPPSVRRGAPVLGEHTREVLTEMGYTPERLAELEQIGAVLSADITRK